MNRSRLLVAAIALVTLCFSSAVRAGEKDESKFGECSLIFPLTDQCEREKSPDGQTYLEAISENIADADEVLGYVFRSTITHDGKDATVLLGLYNDGKIARVRVVSDEPVDWAFVTQFKGRDRNDNFDIATTPQDLIYVPRMIRPMRDIEFSKAISQAVKTLMASAPSELAALK